MQTLRTLLSIFRLLISIFRLPLLSIFKLPLLSILWQLFNLGKSSNFVLTTVTFFHFPLLTHSPLFSHQSISYYLLHFCLHLSCSYYPFVTASYNCIYFIMRHTLKRLQQSKFASILHLAYPPALLQQPLFTHPNSHVSIPSLRRNLVHLFLYEPIDYQLLAFISDLSPQHFFTLIFHFDTTTLF